MLAIRDTFSKLSKYRIKKTNRTKMKGNLMKMNRKLKRTINGLKNRKRLLKQI